MPGLVQSISDAWSWFSGDSTQLGSDQASRWLLRLELYGPLLHAGMLPDQIEAVLLNPDGVLSGARDAYRAMVTQSGAAQAAGQQRAIGAAGNYLIKAATRAGGSSTGAAIGIGLVVKGISAACRASTGCSSGVSQLGARGRAQTAVEHLKQSLHDGMDYARPGDVVSDGTRYFDPSDSARRRKVRHILDWLKRAVDDATQPTLLTLYGQVVCLDAALSAVDQDTRRLLAGKYFASLIAMCQSLAEMARLYGYKKTATLFWGTDPFHQTYQEVDPNHPGKTVRKTYTVENKGASRLYEMDAAAAHGWIKSQEDLLFYNVATDIAKTPEQLVQRLKQLTAALVTSRPQYGASFRCRLAPRPRVQEQRIVQPGLPSWVAPVMIVAAAGLLVLAAREG